MFAPYLGQLIWCLSQILNPNIWQRLARAHISSQIIVPNPRELMSTAEYDEELSRENPSDFHRKDTRRRASSLWLHSLAGYQNISVTNFRECYNSPLVAEGDGLLAIKRWSIAPCLSCVHSLHSFHTQGVGTPDLSAVLDCLREVVQITFWAYQQPHTATAAGRFWKF